MLGFLIMKKIASFLSGFFFLLMSTTLSAESICKTTRVSIKNDSSFDCVLTDFIKPGKTEPDSVIFKNQSIKFDLMSNSKTLILRYQCGHEASVLLYFFQHIESSGRGNYYSDRLKAKPKNLQVKSVRKEGVCNLIKSGSPAQWLLTIEN